MAQLRVSWKLSIHARWGAGILRLGAGAVWCGTRILRVYSRAGRPCHLLKLHQYPPPGL